MLIHRKKLHNSGLWRTRRKRGLERKQVAWLLGHESSDTVSRYERGERRPSLDTAIKLAVLYDTPIEEMFRDHFDVIRSEVSSQVLKIPRYVLPPARASQLAGEVNRCSYEQLLEDPAISETGRGAIRDHITALAKRLAQL